MNFSFKEPLLTQIFDKNGFDFYLVGGAVRDALLGDTPHDYDFTTNAKPDEIIKTLKENGIRFHTTGIQYGTVTAILNNEEYEITTFRKDSKSLDGRHPDEVTFANTIEEDLIRRDFTINSMAINMKTNELVDPFNGAADLNNKIIRCVGNDPKTKIEEDALRIVRALRFSIKFDATIDEELKIAIINNCNLLNNLSKERITDEFRKIFSYNKPIFNTFSEYASVIETIIPEIEPCVGFDQNNKYHKHDVYEHMLAVVDNCKDAKFEIKLAALIHDVGKPAVAEIGEDGYTHFYNHQIESENIAESILKNDFRLTKVEFRYIKDLVRNHDKLLESKKQVRRMYIDHGEMFVRDFTVLRQADADDHIFPDKDKNAAWADCSNVIPMLEEVLAEESCFKLTDLNINGRNIMNLGASGPLIGKTLNHLFNLVIDQNITNEYDSLITEAKSFILEQDLTSSAKTCIENTKASLEKQAADEIQKVNVR